MGLTKEVDDLTLFEAIDILHEQYSGLIKGGDDKTKQWFLNHDASHVIFGTVPFEVKGEALNDVWTIFGSTVTLKEYAEFCKFSSPDKVFQSYGGKFKAFLSLMVAIPECIHVFINTRKMVKKWPWNITEDILLKKVNCLRKHYNIQLTSS